VPDERLAAAVAELYGAAPEVFTGRRVELAAAARSAGDEAAAKAIGALRRPTRTAWVVNRLARTDPSAPLKLANLAAELRAAQRAGDGPRLRELSAARGALIDALTAQALAGVPDPPPSLHAEVAQTLAAALADPEVAAAFAAGTLTRSARWSGFGLAPADAGDVAEEDAADTGGITVLGTAGSGAVKYTDRDRDVADRRGRRGGGGGPGDGGRDARREAAAAAEAAAAERLVREAAQRAARRLEQYEDAERTVAFSSTAAAEAVSAEDRLEAAVRDLEQRLTQARVDLAAARLRARQAEAAERRARQALDRLPSE
jgi:hypothetical protein